MYGVNLPLHVLHCAPSQNVLFKLLWHLQLWRCSAPHCEGCVELMLTHTAIESSQEICMNASA